MHIPPNFEQMPLRPQKLMFEEVCESRVVFIFFVYRDSTFAFKATKWRTNAVTVVSYLLIVAFVQFVCFVCFGCTILAAARWTHICTTRGSILFVWAYTMLFPWSASHLSALLLFFLSLSLSFSLNFSLSRFSLLHLYNYSGNKDTNPLHHDLDTNFFFCFLSLLEGLV